MKCPKCQGLGGYPRCPRCLNKLVVNEEADDRLPLTPCSGSSRLTDVETELRKMTASLSAAGISSSATILQMAADIVAMSGRQAVALNAIAHCDDLVIRGEDDGPELARRLRFAVNTAEAALSG